MASALPHRVSQTPCLNPERVSNTCGGMAAAPLRIRVESDLDEAVPSRILDLLSTIDRYPRRLQLERKECHLVLSLELPPAVTGRFPIAARIRQIAGVRNVLETACGPS
jgi:hypothetical protein